MSRWQCPDCGEIYDGPPSRPCGRPANPTDWRGRPERPAQDREERDDGTR